MSLAHTSSFRSLRIQDRRVTIVLHHRFTGWMARHAGLVSGEKAAAVNKPSAEEKPLAIASPPIYRWDAGDRAQSVVE